MPETRLTDAARTLLRHQIATSDNRVTGANKDAYRERERAGIMYPVSTFARGPEAYYRFTDEGWERRMEWLAAESLDREIV